MIGVDTNVLLRALAGDDIAQSVRARRLLDEASAAGTKVFVNHIVLCELAWVLDRTLRLSRDQIGNVIEALTETAGLEIADRRAVVEALQQFRSGRAGFGDALIGVVNRLAGCSTTHTFDQAAARLDDFSPVPAD